MDKKTILVTAASGIIGYGILKSLRMSGKPYQLIGTTIYEDSIAQAFCDVFVKAPFTHDDNYLEWLLDVVGKYKVDLLIPGYEEDIILWKDNIQELRKIGVKIALNNPQLIDLCKDKWKFYEILEKTNYPFVIPTSLSPEFAELVSDFGLPLFLKPRCGSESKGIVKVFDEPTFVRHRNKVGHELMVQPLVGEDEEEYTTSAFCDGSGGYYALITLRRKLSKLGYTEKAEVANISQIEQAVSSLCDLLNPLGPTNFQFRIHNGNCQLLEINPRFSSATSIRSAFGYNEALMAAEYYLEDKVPEQPKIQQGRAVRYIDEHIFLL